MNKYALTIALAAIAGSNPALAENSVALGMTSASVTYEGTTYAGIIGYGATGSFDITDNIFASGSISMVTVDGSSIAAFDAGAGYLFDNSLDAESGSGSRLGVSISIGGSVAASGEFAVAPGIVASGAVSTTLQNFGSAIGYGVGVEYTPWGLFVGYESVAVSGYDLSLQGVTVGTKLRF